MFELYHITDWVNELLRGCLPAWAATTIECALIAVVLLLAYSLLAILYIFYERKLCAWFQCRLGPMRVGPWGTLQLLADVIKILIKELITLKGIDRFLFGLAPYLVMIASLLVFASLPWGERLQIIDFNMGVFFMLAASSIGVLGILLAGWSSNNKYTMIGAMRSGAQMVSYELSIGISILTMILLVGCFTEGDKTLTVTGVVEAQRNGWLIFRGHISAVIAFVIYLIAATAETNRGPFDLPEAEHELTAGYHTEYSGIHYGFFYLAEYLNLFIVSGIASLMFLGGWMPFHINGLDGFNAVMDYIPSTIWFIGKAFFISFIIIWFKWSYPRVRIDQILSLEWKYLMPIGLFNLVLMALMVVYDLHF